MAVAVYWLEPAGTEWRCPGREPMPHNPSEPGDAVHPANDLYPSDSLYPKG